MTYEEFIATVHSRGVNLADPEGAFAARAAYRFCWLLRPLVRSSGLFLFEHEGEDANGRFAVAFQEAWKRIPLGDRRKLVRYWRANEPLDALLFARPSPFIELSWGWSNSEVGPVVGTWQDEPQALRFWVPVVRTLPHDLLVVLIAHELGHAYWSAIGRADWRTYDPNDPLNPEELQVQEMVELEWGFDEGALSEWLADPENATRWEAERQ